MVELLKFDLNLTESPLAAASLDEMARLAKFVDQINSDPISKAVVVELKNEQSFINENFVNELKQDIYFDELFGRMLHLHYTAEKIAKSHHLWVFVHATDCLGALFDLALAFDKRFCFNTRARVGFPSLAGGFLPFVGPFLKRYGRSSRRKKAWVARDVLRAPDALKSNLLDFVTDHDDWDDDVALLVERFFSEKSQSPGPTAAIKEVSVEDELKVALNKIAETDVLAKARPGKETFEASWALASESKGDTPREAMNAIVYMAARTLVSRGFINWAERHLAIGGADHWLDPNRSKTILVDMDFLAPPVKPLLRLIESGFKVIFCSPDAGRLKEGVDLMYARFENYLNKQDAQSIWREGIAWFTGDIHRVDKLPTGKWLANDRVMIDSADGELTFLRFLGNRGSAECGWAELPLSSPDELEGFHKSYEIARIMSDGIVKTQRLVDDKVDLSTVVRSLFLEEILVVGATLQGATGKLLPSLKDAGWGYVADDNSWEYFLRAREESYRVEASAIKLGSMSLNSEIWRMGVWREGRELAKRSGKKERFTWNPVYMSRHFGTYAALITKEVLKTNAVRDAIDADRFVCGCLGFPQDLGTPLTFMDSLGEKRYQYYCQRFWPQHVGS